MNITITKKQPSISASVTTLPGDKSISHRAAIIGALSENTSVFTHFLFSEDCLNTVAVLEALGVRIERDPSTKTITVHGVGFHGFKEPTGVLDCGNAGTGIRLLTGFLSGQPFKTTITGDHSIQKRPMRRIIDPLTQMGAVITGAAIDGKTDVFPPLHIAPSQGIKAINYTLPVASAQIKSALLFASLYAQDRTEITEPEKCRDHTERMLQGFGADIHFNDKTVFCSGKKPLRNPFDHPIFIPADVSSAAFFLVLGALMPNAELTITGVGLNPTRIACLNVLQQMGASLSFSHAQGGHFEPYGDVTVKTSSLKNITINKDDIPFLIDEIPILSVAAVFSEGVFSVRHAKELRVKESDRIATIGALIKAMGGTFVEYEDGFDIHGNPGLKTQFTAASFGDHRIAMSGLIGAIIGGGGTMTDCACIQTSFPNFMDIVSSLGVSFQSHD